jgi:hypothetical protein
MYWAFTTMVTVGYGDVSAKTNRERLFCMLAMIVAAGFFAYTLNFIGKKVSEYNKLASDFRERMLYVNTWMVNRNLPLVLKTQVRRYLEY